MRKIRLSSHFQDRWRQRVGLDWKASKISDYIYRRFMPRLSKGIEPYILDNELYYVFEAGKVNNKLLFIVLSPGNEGLWSGWYAVTVMTDETIDDIDNYFKWLYDKSEKERNDDGRV